MTERCTTSFYPDGAYCVLCDAQPYIQEVPAHTDVVTVRAWNAGANSIANREAPCYVEWSPSALTAGLFIGLFPVGTFRDVTNPTTLPVAIYIYTIGSSMLAQCYAAAAPLGAPFGVTTSSVLRIERVGNLARYLLGGTELQRATTFDGACRVGACLYASGDNVV